MLHIGPGLYLDGYCNYHWTAKSLWHKTNHAKSTQPSIPLGQVNREWACLAAVKVECAHLRRVASDTLLSHMAGKTQ